MSVAAPPGPGVSPARSALLEAVGFRGRMLVVHEVMLWRPRRLPSAMPQRRGAPEPEGPGALVRPSGSLVGLQLARSIVGEPQHFSGNDEISS